MNFTFEALDREEYTGGGYLMDFGQMKTMEDAAIVEGKLLSVFGTPTIISENYENSFQYVIRATADDGRAVILNVYGMGIVHIGAGQNDEFTVQAATALIAYVNSAISANYQRTVYYLDFDLQIDISVRDGNATITNSQISEEKSRELFEKFYP